MPSLPTVGGDNNAWGTILNTWSLIHANNDGTLKSAAITAALGYTPVNKAGDSGLGALSLGSNALTAGSAILGTTPAAAGTVRLPNTASITGRNALNSADITMLKLTVGNTLELGASAAFAGAKPWIDVTHSTYGADPTGTADATSAINAAIAAAPSRGAIIYVPHGNYKVNGTIDMRDKPKVTLRGDGACRDIYGGAGGTFVRGTVFTRASGTGSMLLMGSNASGTLGQELQGISFNCADLAATGVLVTSLYAGAIRDVFIQNATSVGLDITTVDLGAALEDTQNCRFQDISIALNSTASASAIGMRSGSRGAGEGNTSLNTYANILITHKNGVGAQFNDCDSNSIYGLSVNRIAGGSAYAVELNGTNAFVSTGHCRSNTFAFVNAEAGGLVSRGTGFTTPAVNNLVSFLDLEDGGPAPTIEAGSTLYWTSSTGNSQLASVSVGTSPATVGQLRLGNNQSVYARNSTNTADVALFNCPNFADEFQVQANMRVTALLTLNDGANLALGTGTGTKIGTGTTQKIGVWNAAPVARQSAFTQTYSTADKTLATPTSATLSVSVGTGSTTIPDVGSAFSQATLNNIVRSLADQINALRVDLLDNHQFTNAIVDDFQTIGWLA